MKTKVPTAEEMLSAGVHYGHKSRHWHPKMKKYIHSSHDNVHIIDLYKTQDKLKEAMEFLVDTAKSGKRVIFIGTKDQCRETVEIEAKNSGALFVTERWFGGTLTNFEQIKKNRDELVELKKKMQEDGFKDSTKKERLLVSRKIEKLEKMHGGLVGLNNMPGALVVIDARREKTAVREANATNVPVIALVDTNTDPSGVDYIIPSNDDAIKSTALIIRVLAEAVSEGTSEAMKKPVTDDSKTSKSGHSGLSAGALAKEGGEGNEPIESKNSKSDSKNSKESKTEVAKPKTSTKKATKPTPKKDSKKSSTKKK